MSLSKFIVQRRTALGLSRLQLARASSIPCARVLYLERTPAARRVTPDTFEALARGLDVPVETLLRAAGYLKHGAA